MLLEGLASRFQFRHVRVCSFECLSGFSFFKLYYGDCFLSIVSYIANGKGHSEKDPNKRTVLSKIQKRRAARKVLCDNKFSLTFFPLIAFQCVWLWCTFKTFNDLTENCNFKETSILMKGSQFLKQRKGLEEISFSTWHKVFSLRLSIKQNNEIHCTYSSSTVIINFNYLNPSSTFLLPSHDIAVL